MGKVNFVIDSIRKGIIFTKINFKKLLFEFLIINFFAYLSFILGCMISTWIFFGRINFGPFSIFGAISIGYVFFEIFYSIGYILVDLISKNKEINKTNIFKQNLIPAVKLGAFWVLVSAIMFTVMYVFLFGTFYEGIFGHGSGSGYGMFGQLGNMFAPTGIYLGPQALAGLGNMFALGILIPLITLIFLIIRTPITYILQFTAFEMYVNKCGLIESIYKSARIIKNYFWETLFYWIIKSSILLILLTSVQPIGTLVLLITGTFVSWSGVNILLGNTGFIVLLVFYLILLVIANILDLSLSYAFWKKTSVSNKSD